MKHSIGWVLLAVALLVFGAGVGLGISWGVLPVKMENTVPDTLRQQDKDRYRILIAEDYLVTRDMARAEARLGLLDDKNTILMITDQIDRNAWINEAERNALITLQTALVGSVNSQPLTSSTSPLLILATSSMPVGIITLSPSLSPTTRPAITLTPLITNSPTSFIVISRIPVCDAAKAPPLLQVNVVDSYGKPLSGIVLIINSVEGSERIITGLKPGVGGGSADFSLSEGTIYTIAIENAAGSPEMLTTAPCTSTSGISFPGGWKLQIQY
jgi:hypothetical protein